MTTETPRTDNLLLHNWGTSAAVCDNITNFARELERELNELRKDNENLIDLIIMTIPEIKDLHDEIGCELETCSTLCILESLRAAIDQARNK